MTDQQNHTDVWGMDLIVHRHYARPDQMVITTGTDADDHEKRYSTSVPTARLLAMIDTIDPDAMRAYLLETVPEADPPEDIDERPAPATTERFALLEQVRDLYPSLPPYRHIGVVHWLLEGTELSERIERRLDRSVR